jgi:hypothetical protein
MSSLTDLVWQPEVGVEWLSNVQIVEFEVIDELNRFILSQLSPNVKKWIVCEGIDAVQPIQSGDLCIATQNPSTEFICRTMPSSTSSRGIYTHKRTHFETDF